MLHWSCSGLALVGVHGKNEKKVYEKLHERLAIESMKVSESLNSYCVTVLKDEIEL